MSEKIALVVTSISEPNDCLHKLADGCHERGYDFIVIGDEASPADFHIEGCDFYSIERQLETGFKFAELCPRRHYARKNIGYLIAISRGASVILETDDDNFPYDGFWDERSLSQSTKTLGSAGWVNVYRYFTEANIWPRGLSLNHISSESASYESLVSEEVDCPIQQGLADDNPDVDAIYRLVLPLPQKFIKDRQVALLKGSWCPFNSQNTTWWSAAFGLLYLPAYSSFRMTDIWRSFIAQRTAWENGWGILFGEATMYQERNEHDLMRDFKDEIPGYLHNDRICEELEGLELSGGVDSISSNLQICYSKLVEVGLVDSKEMELVDAWSEDLKQIQ